MESIHLEPDNQHNSASPVQDNVPPVQDSVPPVQDSVPLVRTRKMRRQIATPRAFDGYEVDSMVQRIKMPRKDGADG